MNHQLCVLLYSKYSSQSQQLMKGIQLSAVDLVSSIRLSTVCIDNESIRSKIQKATSVEVTSVPTILLVYNNGGVEKYEGARAFQWISEVIQQLKPKPKPRPIAPSQSTSLPSPPKQVTNPPEPPPSRKKIQKPQSTSIENLNSESNDGHPKPPPVSVRNGAGGYEITDEFSKSARSNQKVSSAKKSTPKNLMSLAQQMQTERETLSSKDKETG